MIPDEYIAIARKTAPEYGLPAALVCAVIEQESAGNPWAIRFESEFYAKYILPIFSTQKLTFTEAYARSMSWGLMQVMGQTAREAGYALELPRLCDPEIGIAIGCRVLEKKMNVALAKRGGQIPPSENAAMFSDALELWNGGSNPNYAAQVLARVSSYS